MCLVTGLRAALPKSLYNNCSPLCFPPAVMGESIGRAYKTAHEHTKDTSGASKVSAFVEKICYFNGTPWMPTAWKIFVF